MTRLFNAKPDVLERWLVIAFVLVTTIGFLVSLLLAACGPAYPACVRDRDCELGEFCVKKLCQLCRSNEDCPLTHRCVQGDCKEGAR